MSDSSERGMALDQLLWSRFIWRHWRREPALTAMLVAILALGVAVFLAVRLANKAAVTGFLLFTESVSGESDFLLRPKAGLLPQGILRDLRRLSGAEPVGLFPVLEESGVRADAVDGEILRLVGVDLVSLRNVALPLATPGKTTTFSSGEGSRDILQSADTGFVGNGFAEKHGVKEGDIVELLVSDRPVSFRIADLLPDIPNRAKVPDNLILMDLPGLQTLSGKSGFLSRVEVRIPPGTDSERIKMLVAEQFGNFAEANDLILETPGERKSSVTQMSAAFRLNLTILSGLALLVGLYLIMQAMEASVVKRRAEIAVLRSLGVTPHQIRRAWMLEGLILGIVGSLLGVLLGRFLAIGMVGAIAQTVNTIYYETTTTAVTLTSGEVLFSLLFGIFSSVVAGIVPARDAALTPPAQAMRQGIQGGGLKLLRKGALGLLFFVCGLGAAFLPPIQLTSGTVVPVGGYLAAMLFVFAASILIGALFRPVARLLRGISPETMRNYAASQLRRPEGRHRLTAAGLSVAIGMSAAMAILVASFETTLTSWIEQLLKADLYVAAAGASSVTNTNIISRENCEKILSIPGVEGSDKLRRYTIRYQGNEVFLGGADYNLDPERFLQLLWIEPPLASGPLALLPTESGPVPAWVSESFSRKFGSGKGDRLEIPTPAGAQAVEVAGVYAEYGTEMGTIIVSRTLTSHWFADDSLSQMAIYASREFDVEAVLDEIQATVPGLVVRTNARLRAESIRIFHQTFAVTYALEAIAVVIAIAGLGLALAGLLLERRSELATLRAVGATRADIARAAMWEGIGLAVVGLIGGYLLSLILGWVLIYVINPQSFGWTLRYRIPWISFSILAGVTLATAAIVSRIVGSRNANLLSDRTS